LYGVQRARSFLRGGTAGRREESTPMVEQLTAARNPILAELDRPVGIIETLGTGITLAGGTRRLGPLLRETGGP
jgi:hypothetical protein